MQYNHTFLKIFTFSEMLLPFHVICWLIFAQMHFATLSSKIYSDLYWSDMLQIWMQIWNAFKKTILEMVKIVTINIILDNPQVGQFSFEGPISSLPCISNSQLKKATKLVKESRQVILVFIILIMSSPTAIQINYVLVVDDFYN